MQSFSKETSCDPSKPYNDLPTLPPGKDIETKEILKKCVTARSALATLKQAALLIPNQAVLINSIPLREAQDSSAIENIVTTNDKLFRFANIDEEKADPATKETLRYRAALLTGFQSIREKPLTSNSAVAICRAIKNIALDVRKTPGTILKNAVTGKTVYTPPEGERLLRELLSNWETFLHNESDIDPLVRMAVAHYQFEAIHPFTDGNGRTGRILNILYIIDQKLLDLPILYLSGYILNNRERYYELLGNVTFKHEWQEWILYMLDAVEQTAEWTTKKITEIKSLIESISKEVMNKCPGIYKRELIEAFFSQPYCRTTDITNKGFGHRNTISKHLNALADIGVLERRKEGREILYINRKFIDMLIED